MWSAPAPPVNYGSNSGSGVFGGSLYGQAAGESEGSVTTASPISHGSVGSTGNTHQALVAPESLPSLPTSSNNPSGVTSTSSTHHQTKPSSHSNLNNGGAAGRTRRRKWTMEERQEHSVLEKKRREEFNVLLLVGATCNPPLVRVGTWRISMVTISGDGGEHTDCPVISDTHRISHGSFRISLGGRI